MDREQYLLRSLLFVPGNSEKLQLSASHSKADAIILDLEDSVLDRFKEEARQIIIKNIKLGIFADFTVFVRLNDRVSGYLLQDLNKLMIPGITGFIFPKVEDEKDIVFFDKLLDALEVEKGIESGTFKIVPLIETAGAVLKLEKICKTSSRIIAVTYGSEDFTVSIHGIHDRKGESLFVPRALTVIAARAAGIIPIDTLHVNVHDLDDLEDNLKLVKNLGFEGMLLLHPKEIELAHRYFTPTAEEITNAEELIRLNDIADKSDRKVAIIEGKIVGPPMLLKARQILDRQELIKKQGK